MNKITIKQASWQLHEQELRELRDTVFVKEQHVPPELEWEGDDEDAYHWIAYNEHNKAVGCSRLLKSGAIGRMAILKEARGLHIGQQLLQAAIEYSQQVLAYEEVFLSAQTHAIAFYQKSGFIEEGDIYEDAGIPHITMRKKLAPKRLGIDAGKFFVHDHKTQAFNLIQQCQRQLRILNYDLAHTVFDNSDLCDAISVLARKHRYSEVKILVVDSKPIIKQGHQLLKLLRKLPSSINIKQLVDDTAVKENFIIADQCGLLVQPLLNPEAIWADFNNQPVCQTKIDHFEILWNQANDNPEFRTLDI